MALLKSGPADAHEAAPVLPHIERDFDLRTAFPDYIDFFKQWETRSQVARTTSAPVLDIAYGSGDRDRLDFFPAKDPDRPVIVFIHGGYWRAMDKADFSFVAPPLVERDFNVALLNYPLTPSVRIREIVTHVRAGCRWLCENMGHLRADGTGLHLIGWSAGAHLSMMMAAESGQSPLLCPIKTVLAISGIYDLFPVRHTTANAGFRLTHMEAQLNSPLYLMPNVGTKLGVVWGALETPSFRAQSLALANAWNGARRLEVPGCHHYAVMNELGDPESEVGSLALELVQSSLNG